MTRLPGQVPDSSEGVHLVLYDGVCGLCSRLLQFVLRRDRRAVFSFTSLQGTLGRATVGRFGGNPDDVTSFYVLANYRTADARMFSRSRAALFVVRQLGWPWKSATILGVLPTALLDRVYDALARNRYRVFGASEQCLMPREEFRRRLVD